MNIITCNIKNNLNKIKKKYKNKKIILYGANDFTQYIFNNYDLSGLNIVAIADLKFKNKKEDLYNNIKCISPDELKDIEADCILILVFSGYQIYSYIRTMFINQNHKSDIAIEWILEPNLVDTLINRLKYKLPEHKNKKYIFTFWEPKSKMPAYIKLCMQTWNKFLPEYEIVLLDYTNLSDWLGHDFYDEYLYKNFSLAIQADAIRAAVLHRYGGIWFDADTIITSEKIKDIINQKSEVVMFRTNIIHIGFIVAKKGSKILKKWVNGIKKNIFIHKIYKSFSSQLKYIINFRKISKFDNWDYLGNYIVEDLKEKFNQKDFLLLDCHNYMSLPEVKYYDNSMLVNDMYTNFYFKNDFSDYIQKNEHGIILLHNSWTPKEFKDMSEEEFINQNCTLSKILNRVLQK